MTTVDALRRSPMPVGVALLTTLLVGGCSSPSEHPASVAPSPTASSEVEMRMVRPPEKLGQYRLTTDPAVDGETGRIAGALAKLLDEPATSSIAISYQDPRYPEHTTRLSGVSGRVGNPEGVLDVIFAEIHQAHDVAPVAAGQLGGLARCGKAEDLDAHICAWADHGSIGSMTITGPSEDRVPVRDFLFLRGRAERPAAEASRPA
ncbi:hypothetical protein [Micromonospora sp. 4G55]|uniref:hypothetical protein n=1 Tax=Micromonospora sp. 4G55 TaxID=2806102 RepID=UPI001A4D0E1B|nr:hypothetical protein [Micromonospora sp. 4G55]MBM0259663.1 hypothetical protein [Micromonospora sp. 4G55]